MGANKKDKKEKKKSKKFSDKKKERENFGGGDGFIKVLRSPVDSPPDFDRD